MPETSDSFPPVLMEFHRTSAANIITFLLKIVQVRRLLKSVRSLEAELSCDACHPVQASSTVDYLACTPYRGLTALPSVDTATMFASC